MKVLRFYAEGPREIFDGNTGSSAFWSAAKIESFNAPRLALDFDSACWSFALGAFTCLLARTALDFRILRRVRVDGMVGSDT